MNRNDKIIILIGVIIAIAVSVYLIGVFNSGGLNEEGSIDILVGAGFSKVGADLINAFNEKYPNIKVNAKYGGSGEIFATLETQNSGDIFLPSDYKYMQDAMDNGYIENDTVKNITKNVPAIIVEKGNPKSINSLDDLAKPGVKVSVGEPDGPAIGKITAKILEKNNLADAVEENVVVKSGTVNQLLTYLVTGQVDATIIWEDMKVWEEGEGKIEVINIPNEKNIESTVPIGITTFVKDKDASLKFKEFIISEEAKEIWEKWGFEV